jgi:hypothetical protein
MRQRTHSAASVNTATGLLYFSLFLVAALFVLGSINVSTGANASTNPSARHHDGAPSAPSTLPPIPPRMPVYFNFGLFNTDVNSAPASIPWDFRYQYLAGGVNTGNGWATWNTPPGQYATNYIQDARSRGMIPAFMYYQILQSAPNYDEYQNMQNAGTMYSYFADWKLLMTRSAQAGGTIVVMLEGDLTGVMQQRSTNDDATTVHASVASSGYPDAANFGDNFKGMYQTMLHMRNLYAPNVLVTVDVSDWGEGDDLVLSLHADPTYDWQHHADRTAAFLNSLGSGFDMLSWDPSDRDAAWYQATRGINNWWDDTNVTQPTFNTMGAWIGRIVQETNKRVVMWQVPNGNRVYRSENNTSGHWQDNRAEYFLNPATGRQHVQDWANLGVLGIWWGAGEGDQTHYDDSNGDGITNPPPINGNNQVAQNADDDGGYIRVGSSAYYAQGPVYLPGGVPPTPTATPICGTAFEDVPAGSTFYQYVTCLICQGIVSGYACGGPGEPCDPAHDPYFRPNSSVTRGQLAKIVSQAAGFNEQITVQTFQDVAAGSTFFNYVGRLATRGIMAGYTCGNPEPCVPPRNLPYFRPSGKATRGQLAKIVSKAANYTEPVSGQTFQDVPPASTFYDYIERLAGRGIIGGYSCGHLEPCVPPANLPYFRPNGTVTRGQTSKVVSSAFFQQCPLSLRH